MYEIFARILKERNLRPADVCRGTGLPSSLFSEWKKGKSTPKTDKLQKIADYFEVSLEFLTGKDSSPEKATLSGDIAPEFLALFSKMKELGIEPEELDPTLDLLGKLKNK